MESITFLIMVLAIYLLPVLIASTRKHNNFGSILMLNLLAGWTGIGWIIAAVWAMSDNIEVAELKAGE